MGRIALDTLLFLTDQAFEDDSAQSLFASLREVRAEDWTTLPTGAGRTIAEILEHVGWAKWMYQDYAFGPASMRGDRPPLVPEGGAPSRPPDELIPWVREGHRRWRDSIGALSDDAELGRERKANWGELLTTRKLIEILIGHDFYHAGEINHLRAVLQGNDRWPY